MGKVSLFQIRIGGEVKRFKHGVLCIERHKSGTMAEIERFQRRAVTDKTGKRTVLGKIQLHQHALARDI